MKSSILLLGTVFLKRLVYISLFFTLCCYGRQTFHWDLALFGSFIALFSLVYSFLDLHAEKELFCVFFELLC